MSETLEVWVCPPLDETTGGNLCNARLLDALVQRGVHASRVDFEGARRALRSELPGRYWVDSLYLDRLPELASENVGCMPLCLVVHYLPSLLRCEAVPPPSELGAGERAALDIADAFWAPSSYIADALVSFGVSRDRIVTAPPGVDVEREPPSNGLPREGVRAAIVANVLPGKGIAPFLRALAPECASAPSFELSVMGSVDHDPEYAADCRAIVAQDPVLARSVRFEGSLPHRQVVRRLSGTDIFVSPSRMEAFGLALAEARALGLPILARRAGNAPAHVEEAAGGELFDGDTELARGFLRLVCDGAERERRMRLAEARRRRRKWDHAAADFIEGARRLPPRASSCEEIAACDASRS